MSITVSKRSAILGWACGGVAALTLATGLTPRAQGALIPVGADAEIREDAPETARGATATNTELSVRVTANQNRAFILRFDLTGFTSADLQGHADIRLFSRNASLGGTNAGGIKIYGLNGNAPLATTWDETTVTYRDAGDGIPVSPVGGHPGSQPSPGAGPAAGAPVAPIAVSNAPSWNSNPNAATRTPGLKHENPAYSAAAETTNATRYSANQQNYTNYQNDLADNGAADHSYVVANPGFDWTTTYQSYINQPAYMATSGTNYPDLASYDRPGATIGADLDPTLTTFLGYLNYDAKNPSRAAGTMFSFTTGDENSPVNMGPSVYGANNTALVNYLTALLDGGYTSATFLIFQKNAVDGDTLPVRSDNLIFASKEFQPTGGSLGAWAPQLILAPEPGAATLLAIGAVGLIGRRSRKAR